MEFHLSDYIHRFLVDFFCHSSSHCTFCWQKNVASSGCSIRGAFLNNRCCQLLLWELAPSNSREEDKTLSARSCARSLCDHKLQANGTHFPGEKCHQRRPHNSPAIFSQLICLLLGLAEPGCRFPSCMAMQSALFSVPFTSSEVTVTVL